MSSAAFARSVLADTPTGWRPPMSNLRFFLTSYAGGLAFFLTIIA